MHAVELHADLETPVTAYLKLRRDNPWSFLFESVEGPTHWATYSILGFGARRIYRANGGEVEILDGDGTIIDTKNHSDPLAALREAVKSHSLVKKDAPTTVGQASKTRSEQPACVGGVFGFLSYDAVRFFEPLGTCNAPPDVPDALFVEPELVAVFDNRRHSLTLYCSDQSRLDDARVALRCALPPHPGASGFEQPTPLDSRDSFMESVLAAKEQIVAGEVIQVVLSRRFALPPLAPPFDIYRGLRAINPSPYMYYLATPDTWIAGASPEVMVRIQNNRITLRPIAGTRPRGAGESEDQRLAAELLADEKERAEHIMLVDLGRNDTGRVSKPGSVDVERLMEIELYSHVMHIVSQVSGELASGHDAFDALRAAFPAGTLSGAPKVRAMQLIDHFENSRRGIYGGAVGYFAPNGDADFGIAIRTLVAKADRFLVQAGAGIVADSVPITETDETEAKARAVLRAAAWACSDHARW